MLAQLRAWVEIETPSGEPARVAALADDVVRAFEAEGCRATRYADAVQLDAGPLPGARPPLLVLGHLDTVYPAGTLARTPFRPEAAGGEEDGRAYGPGVFDMKAGLVQALFALRALGPRGLPRTVRFLFVFDEEIGSPRSRPLTEALAREAEAALVLEPAAGEAGDLKVARKGIARYRLAAHGVAAHAGLDFAQGASAILELAGRLQELAAWTDLDRGLTLNPGLIVGGSAVNVVPAEAGAEIEARAWTAAELAGIDQRLRALRSASPRVRLELTGGLNRPPLEPTAASAALRARAQAIAGDLGFELGATRVGGASDGNFTAACGLPTLDGLGAVGAGAHSPDEHILIRHLAPRTALLARLLTSLG